VFSGYVTVDEDSGRALFYAFVESARNAKEDPLVLWMNGGPGCSSLAGGFLSELGPFYPTPGGKLQRNRHAWTDYANIIFLESPAFVGWSYSNTSDDAVVGDKRTAADAYEFLRGWLERFPQYADRPLWLAGESYGGHYVPNLALEIVERNQKAASEDKVNLRGFLVGNAWTDPETDNRGTLDFWWSHAIVSDEVRSALSDYCNFSDIGPLSQVKQSNLTLFASNSDKDAKCQDALIATYAGMGKINIYDIYVDVCLPKPAYDEVRTLGAALAGGHVAFANPNALQEPGYDPCVDNEVEIYFNRVDVQQAMHANSSATHLNWPWQTCSPHVNYSRADLFSSMLPVWKRLLESDHKLAMMVYSGDVDGIVPVVGTRRWVHGLGLGTIEAWRPWYSATGQTGGYVQVYDGLTLTTVRNAGHMVPYTEPERGQYMFAHWIHHQKL
jgi:serine carboxypeptidase-like clade 2